MITNFLFITTFISLIILGNARVQIFYDLKPEVEQNYIDAFKGFSADLLCLQPDVADVPHFGAYPFGVAYVMSLLHQQVWKINTEGFETALRVPTENITEELSSVRSLMRKDSSTNLHSLIYTPHKGQPNISSYAVTKALQASVWFIEKYAWENSRKYVNGEIRRLTNRKLYTDFVPEGGWYGPDIIQNYTKALYINTFEVEYNWNTEISISEHQNKDGKFTTEIFSNYTGQIGFLDNDKFSAYSVPLEAISIKPWEGPKPVSRSMVFVQPKASLSEFLTNGIQEVFRIRNSDWTNKTIQFQVPIVNLSLPTITEIQLQKLGVGNTFCNVDRSEENFVQRIAQKLHVYLGPGSVQFASATGITINNFKEFSEALQLSSTRNSKPTNNVPNCLNCQCSGDTLKQNSARINSDPQIPELVTLKKPFIFYLNDADLGPIFLGVVNSDEHEETTSDDLGLSEALSYSRWSCP